MYEDIYCEIGKKIAYYRWRQGQSQEALAEKCSLSRSRISLIECGKCHFNMDTLLLLVKALDITLEELFSHEGSVAEK